MNPPRAQFPVCALVICHFGEVEFALLGKDKNMGKRFAGSKNMTAALCRGFENDEEQHRPPVAHQRGYSDGNCRFDRYRNAGVAPF